MGRGGLGLFSGLALVGAISGFVLGELFLGRGNGLYVAPVSAVVGLLLAWALWHTRPAGEPGQAAEATSESPQDTPQERRRASGARVAKSQQGGKKR